MRQALSIHVLDISFQGMRLSGAYRDHASRRRMLSALNLTPIHYLRLQLLPLSSHYSFLCLPPE